MSDKRTVQNFIGGSAVDAQDGRRADLIRHLALARELAG